MTLEQVEILRNINVNLEEILKLLKNITEGEKVLHTYYNKYRYHTGGPL